MSTCPRFSGRERIVVIGSESTPDQRLAALGRFVPTVLSGTTMSPSRARWTCCFQLMCFPRARTCSRRRKSSREMPWNPECIVQRNGRVIRLMSDHDEVDLWTMLPEQGEPQRGPGSRRGSRPRSKRPAACTAWRLRSSRAWRLSWERLAIIDAFVAGDQELLSEPEETSGAFIGEERGARSTGAAEGKVERGINCRGGSGGPPDSERTLRRPPVRLRHSDSAHAGRSRRLPQPALRRTSCTGVDPDHL